jgi:hypothetical protein
MQTLKSFSSYGPKPIPSLSHVIFSVREKRIRAASSRFHD